MSSWKMIAIGDAVDQTPTWNPARMGGDGTFTYIDLSAIDQESKTILAPRQVRCPEAPSRARQLVSAGDVLVSTVRPNLNGVARVPLELDGATASTGFCVLRPRPSCLESRYLFHWVKTPSFIADLTRQATGASYPAVSERIILESHLPVPPVTEQRRIAEVLDRAETLRAKRRATLAQIDEFATALFLDMFGDPVLNAKRWPRVPLGELLSDIESGWSPTCLDRPVAGGEWGVLKLGAVTWCEYDPAENKALPPGIMPNEKLEVREGDILFARKNTSELVAACALVRATPPRLCLPDLIFRLRLAQGPIIDPTYLHRLLIYPTKRREIQKLASGSAASMPNISKSRLRSTMIEVPPLPLQREFARRTTVVETMKNAHRSSLVELDALFASLQYRAFRGEL